MKLDLENSNVQVIETKVLNVRHFFDNNEMNLEDILNDIHTSLDNAQAQAQNQGVAYIVIAVRR